MVRVYVCVYMCVFVCVCVSPSFLLIFLFVVTSGSLTFRSNVLLLFRHCEDKIGD